MVLDEPIYRYQLNSGAFNRLVPLISQRNLLYLTSSISRNERGQYVVCLTLKGKFCGPVHYLQLDNPSWTAVEAV